MKKILLSTFLCFFLWVFIDYKIDDSEVFNAVYKTLENQIKVRFANALFGVLEHFKWSRDQLTYDLEHLTWLPVRFSWARETEN